MNSCNTCKYFNQINRTKGLCFFMNSRIAVYSNDINKKNIIKDDPHNKSIIINTNNSDHNWVWTDINFGCKWHLPHPLNFNTDNQRTLILKYFPDANNFRLHRKYNRNRHIEFCSKEKIKDTKTIYLEDGLEIVFGSFKSKSYENRKWMSYHLYADEILKKIIDREHF